MLSSKVFVLVVFTLLQLEDTDAAKKATSCGVASEVPREDAEVMLQAHNDFRRKAPASDMKKLVWSSELANKAQQLANTCVFKHSLLRDCRNKRIGQNIWMAAPKRKGKGKMNWKGPVNAWHNEIKWYTYKTHKCKQHKSCGHYTQVVWAKTSEVGCGMAYCKSLQLGSRKVKNAAMAVCDYRKPGNYVGVRPYKEGSSCSACQFYTWKSGWKCDNGLCAPCNLKSDKNCKCPANSCNQTQGTLEVKKSANGKCTSQCVCKKGFWGADCGSTCECTGKDVWKSWQCARFRNKQCKDRRYRKFMMKKCYATCFCPNPKNLPETCK